MKTNAITLSMHLLCIAFFLLLTCCSDDTQTAQLGTFKIEEVHLQQNFKQEKSTVSIPVSTNMEPSAWSVNSSEEWCVASKASGSVNVISLVIGASEEVDVRTAKVHVKSSVENYTIHVSQLGYGPAILVKGDPDKFTAAGGDLVITVTSNVKYTLALPTDCDWIKEITKTKAFSDYEHLFSVSANSQYENRSADITFAYNEYKDKEPIVYTVVLQAKSGTAGDVEVEEDIRVLPSGGKSNQAHAGNDIDKSYDNNLETTYHSPWQKPYDDPTTVMPIILQYFFDGKQEINYVNYIPSGGNGNFGKLKLWIKTETGGSDRLLGEYDFQMKSTPSRIVLSGNLKPVEIKFEVLSGAGAQNDAPDGFAACKEMQFFRKNTENSLNRQLLAVFTDITCTELLPGVTTEEISALPGYFGLLAIELRNGTYDENEKAFRIRDYAPYSIAEEWAETLMTKKYSTLDNCTGIYANAGDSIIVLVGNTLGQQISLQSIEAVGASGDVYFLEEGVNKIAIRQKGLLYIMYHTDITASNAKPIRIHFPLGSGVVNGFFDLKEHKTDAKYAELLSRATYKYFEVRGERIIFKFHVSKLREFVKTEILSAITLWDNIIGWQQELMGIEDVRPSRFNNRVCAISPEDGYMWASDYQIGFVYTYLGNILLYNNVMAAKDNAWGPAHEIGHIHQRAINWPSSTESSNNLFSNFILYKLGKYCSRGTELSSLATARCVNKQGWCNMGDPTHQNEDTEIHMRMNWQLWNYYYRCGYKTNFWPTLFKLLRETRIVESDPGAGQLLFAKMACKAANEDLSDFFEMWGFFEEVDTEIEQYGDWHYVVTADMIRQAKAYMSQFPKPKHAFYYLEDRKNGDVGIENYQVGDVGYYLQFKNDVKITQAISYSLLDRIVTIKNGSEAVAFEIKKDKELLFFSNFYTFTVPESVALTDATVYAVQANGQRIALAAE